MTISLSVVSQLLGGSGGGAATVDAGTAVLNLRRALKPGAEAKGIEAEAKDPVTISAIAQFKAALGKAKSVDQALSDPRIQAVLLPALGLANQIGSTGLVRKGLQSDPDDTGSLAAALGETWVNAAKTLDLKEKGLAALQDPELQQKLIDGYQQYRYRTGLDEQTAGLSDALYFIEQAKTATETYDVLGNNVLRRVVTGGLGIPQELALQEVEAQARTLEKTFDIDTLQNPKDVQKLAERYLIAAAGSGTGGGSRSYLTTLFSV